MFFFITRWTIQALESLWFILENSEIQFLLSINKLYISWQLLKFVLFESQSIFSFICMFCMYLLVCVFSFGHCVVCSSSNYGIWLPLWYLQSLLINLKFKNNIPILLLPQIICNKNVDIKFSAHSGITLIRYAQSRKIGQPNDLKVFESNKTKWPKQDSQFRLQTHIAENENLSFNHNYII